MVRSRFAGARAWIEAQNKCHPQYLADAPGRERIKQRLTSFGTTALRRLSPAKVRYFYSRNDGRRTRRCVLAGTLNGEARLLIDPEHAVHRGTIALSGVRGQRRRQALRVLAIGRRLGLAHDQGARRRLRDRYLRRDPLGESSPPSRGRRTARASTTAASTRPGENAPKAVKQVPKVYFHALGTPQARDVLVYGARTNPMGLRRGGLRRRPLSGDHRVAGHRRAQSSVLQGPLARRAPVVEMIARGTAPYQFIGNQGPKFSCDRRGAERYRVGRDRRCEARAVRTGASSYRSHGPDPHTAVSLVNRTLIATI